MGNHLKKGKNEKASDKHCIIPKNRGLIHCNLYSSSPKKRMNSRELHDIEVHRSRAEKKAKRDLFSNCPREVVIEAEKDKGDENNVVMKWTQTESTNAENLPEATISDTTIEVIKKAEKEKGDENNVVIESTEPTNAENLPEAIISRPSIHNNKDMPKNKEEKVEQSLILNVKVDERKKSKISSKMSWEGNDNTVIRRKEFENILEESVHTKRTYENDELFLDGMRIDIIKHSKKFRSNKHLFPQELLEQIEKGIVPDHTKYKTFLTGTMITYPAHIKHHWLPYVRLLVGEDFDLLRYIAFHDPDQLVLLQDPAGFYEMYPMLGGSTKQGVLASWYAMWNYIKVKAKENETFENCFMMSQRKKEDGSFYKVSREEAQLRKELFLKRHRGIDKESDHAKLFTAFKHTGEDEAKRRKASAIELHGDRPKKAEVIIKKINDSDPYKEQRDIFVNTVEKIENDGQYIPSTEDFNVCTAHVTLDVLMSGGLRSEAYLNCTLGDFSAGEKLKGECGGGEQCTGCFKVIRELHKNPVMPVKLFFHPTLYTKVLMLIKIQERFLHKKPEFFRDVTRPLFLSHTLKRLPRFDLSLMQHVTGDYNLTSQTWRLMAGSWSYFHSDESIRASEQYALCHTPETRARYYLNERDKTASASLFSHALWKARNISLTNIKLPAVDSIELVIKGSKEDVTKKKLQFERDEQERKDYATKRESSTTFILARDRNLFLQILYQNREKNGWIKDGIGRFNTALCKSFYEMVDDDSTNSLQAEFLDTIYEIARQLASKYIYPDAVSLENEVAKSFIENLRSLSRVDSKAMKGCKNPITLHICKSYLNGLGVLLGMKEGSKLYSQIEAYGSGQFIEEKDSEVQKTEDPGVKKTLKRKAPVTATKTKRKRCQVNRKDSKEVGYEASGEDEKIQEATPVKKVPRKEKGKEKPLRLHEKVKIIKQILVSTKHPMALTKSSAETKKKFQTLITAIYPNGGRSCSGVRTAWFESSERGGTALRDIVKEVLNDKGRGLPSDSATVFKAIENSLEVLHPEQELYPSSSSSDTE